jgi:glutamate 5-kinase
VVVKVGSSTLTGGSGRLDRAFINDLAAQISDVWTRGQRVVLVSSGAITAGAERLEMKGRPRALAMKQAAAAVGQGLLMEVYSAAFGACDRAVAQVLLTRQDTADRSRYVNARHTLASLLRLGVVPIVNENDTVSVDEIRFGDNDTLAALVASLVQADLLILLTDVVGFFGPDGTVLSVVSEITPDLIALAGGAGSANGTGGMVTKLQAASIAGEAGIPTVIARGREPGILSSVLRNDGVGTRFLPRARRMSGRKQWIAFAVPPRGTLAVNACARRALVDHRRSLLPVGVVRVEGHFQTGDTVRIVDEDGTEFARGVVSCDHREATLILGQRTDRIAALVGRDDLQELVHRDNLVLLALPGRQATESVSSVRDALNTGVSTNDN